MFTIENIESGAPLRLAVLVAMLAGGCGGSSAPQPPAVGQAPDPSISIKGTEKIAWIQSAHDAKQLARLQYIAYVDGAPQVLADVKCDSTPTTGSFACSAKLPPMSVGRHQLQLVAEETDGQKEQSSRSTVLAVNVVVTKD